MTIRQKIQGRLGGSMISKETGEAIAYSLDKLQDRGKFFIEPNDEIYTGMVVGENSRGGDLMMKTHLNDGNFKGEIAEKFEDLMQVLRR